MALEYPTFDFLNQQGRAELARQQPTIDPTIFGSFASPFITSASALAYTTTLTIRDLEKQAFPQTATGEFLDTIGAYEPLARNPATPASGDISIVGISSTIVPAGTAFTSALSLAYLSTAVSEVDDISISVTSLVLSGTTVTATTASDHTFATGLTVTIAGANETDYNGAFDITVTGRDEFTYTISTSPSSPATGAITADSTYAIVNVESSTEGQSTNLTTGALLALDLEITGLTSPGFVQFDGLTGGAAEETDEDYSERLILSRSIIEGVFTQNQIKLAALSVTGNTRAFVIPAALSTCATPVAGFIPAAGEVAIYILRDDDDNIIPSQTVLNTTKDVILAEGKLPANTFEGDVYVLAPITVSTDFTFSAIDPNTATMQAAITAQLQAFFEDIVDFQETVTEERYISAIDQTVDLSTGTRITSFTLSAPSGDIVIVDGEIAILGIVTFA